MDRGNNPLNRSLTVRWDPPISPETFATDCLPEYLVHLIHSEKGINRTEIVEGDSF